MMNSLNVRGPSKTHLREQLKHGGTVTISNVGEVSIKAVKKRVVNVIDDDNIEWGGVKLRYAIHFKPDPFLEDIRQGL